MLDNKLSEMPLPVIQENDSSLDKEEIQDNI